MKNNNDMSRPLYEADPQVAVAIDNEVRRQHEGLELFSEAINSKPSCWRRTSLSIATATCGSASYSGRDISLLFFMAVTRIRQELLIMRFVNMLGPPRRGRDRSWLPTQRPVKGKNQIPRRLASE